MPMDAAWHVYIQDRRFDDDEISNTYIKYRFETVGRFTFDLRLKNSDELSYFATGNTLRVFWGDVHKLDGVIQRWDWDADKWCYHVYGADIRGLLLDRVPLEPATINSYTSDITTSLMFDSCDFPSNIWTVAGDSIGTYTFNYKLGIHKTIRITRYLPLYIWEVGTVIERGTVYNHINGCIFDATKNWATNEFQGMVLRFVSGECKNKVYNICTNSKNKVCLRMATESCASFATDDSGFPTQQVIDGQVYRQIVVSADFESGSLADWATCWNGIGSTPGGVSLETPGCGSDTCLYMHSGSSAWGLWPKSFATQTGTVKYPFENGAYLEIRYKQRRTPATTVFQGLQGQFELKDSPMDVWYFTSLPWGTGGASNTNPSWPDWDCATINHVMSAARTSSIVLKFSAETYSLYGEMEAWLDNVAMWVPTTDPYYAGDLAGHVPECSRIGDIYEIVLTRRTLSYKRPPELATATLEKNNHIIRFNDEDDLSRHTTFMSVRGNG